VATLVALPKKPIASAMGFFIKPFIKNKGAFGKKVVQVFVSVASDHCP
jgi:hypothetical protein